MTNRTKERGDIEWVVLVVVIIFAMLFIIVGIMSYSEMHARCEQYDNTPLKDVPAKCVNDRGGTY